jgi:membrane AbrB-like protein
MPPVSQPKGLLDVAETLLIAAAGGIAFTLMGFPAGFVSGSVLTTAVAALAGRPMRVPLPMARVCFVMVGILLGGAVTPETLRGIGTWPLSIAILVVSIICMLAATTSYLRFVHGWSPISALLGASPGSMAQAFALSAELGADMRGVAIVQTMRILVITVALPGTLALFGLAGGAGLGSTAVAGTSWGELAVLFAVSTALALFMLWLRFPGGLLFGSMAGSAILHGGGFIHAVLPWWIASAVLIVMGGVVGARFANTSPRVLLDYLGAALGSALVATAVACLFGLIVASFLPFPVSDVVIAFAPGAQDTMMVLALALQLDPVYVGAHHLSRWLVVTFTVAFAARRLARRAPDRNAKDSGAIPPPARGP